MKSPATEVRRNALDKPLVDPRKFIAAMFLCPVIAVVAMALFFLPDHVPSKALAKAPAGAPSANPESVADKIQSCRLGLRIEPDRLRERPLEIWSWENDEGLIARTIVRCRADHCDVQASALIGLARSRPFSCSRRRGILFQ